MLAKITGGKIICCVVCAKKNLKNIYIKILKLSNDLNNKFKKYQFKIKLVSYIAINP